jgi:hypothetical protein
MADSSVAILDASGISRPADAQLVGTDYQQTVTLGDGTNAGRVAAIDPDGSVRVETNVCTTATKTNVTSVTTSVTILAANAARRAALIFNDSTSLLYLSLGTGATSTTSFSVRVAAGTLYVLDIPLWTGAVTGTWSAVNGAARVTDIGA